MGTGGFGGFPSGKQLRNYGKIHYFYIRAGKTHHFNGGLGFLYVYTMLFFCFFWVFPRKTMKKSIAFVGRIWVS